MFSLIVQRLGLYISENMQSIPVIIGCDIKRIHDLLHTLPAVTKSANYENIRTEEHSGYAAFGEAAEELVRCLMNEKAPPTFWAKLATDQPAWDEDDGTEQAEAILLELYITVLAAIDSQCHAGSSF